MTELVFLDVNVFMYAAGTPHPYKDACVRILSRVEVGTLAAAIDTEVPQEVLYRYSAIGLPEKGIQLCRDILAYPLLIIAVSEADIRLAIDMFDAYRAVGLKPRDAIHAATMRNKGITRLISADRDFDHLTDVTRVDPLAFT